MTILRPLVLSVVALATVASAQTRDHAPTGLPSSSRMSQDKPGKENWTYVKPGLDLRRVTSIIIDPTVVYTGPDAQFEDIDPADRQRFATILTEQMRAEMGKSFTVTSRPGSDTLRLRVTLLGAEGTAGGVATATRVTPLGLASNAVRSLAGKPGRLTGSMLVAVELTDSRSGELQAAAVRRRTPNALDIPATLSTTETVKAVAHDLAKDLREKMEKSAGRG